MKKRCIARKGYFFLIDSVLALGILVIGGFLVFSLFIKTPQKEEPIVLSEDTMDFFAITKIKDVSNDYVRLDGELWKQGLIINAENTLLQQVGVFYANNNFGVAEKFIANLTEEIVPKQYFFEFRMNGELLFPRNPSQRHSASKDITSILIPSRKIVFGFLDDETAELYGPYSAEVLVWQGK
jgi:hypothetical protein